MEFDSSYPELQTIARTVFDKIPKDAQQSIQSACERVTFIGNYEAEFLPCKGVILVVVSRINDFSEKGKRGILAHEFGHAYVYATGYHQSGERAEKLANMAAQQWGFLTDIDAMKADTVRLRGSH